MRNLRNIARGVFRKPTSSPDIAASCWDVAKDEVIVAYLHGPTEESEVSRFELVRLAKDSRQPSNLLPTRIAWIETSPDTIQSLHHCSDTLTTCLFLAGGDIITVVEDEHSGGDAAESAHVEIVGTVEPSIVAVGWSPDEELLVIVTGDGQAVFMSRTFDLITMTPFSADDLSKSKHVSVGWGKKETQFQGKGAKAKGLRDPTIPEKVDQGTLSPNDDGRCTVSWRGDGAYVAINFLQEGVRRVIRVFNRDGELDSVSEPVDGLEGSLSWRPEGNLMAGIQRLADRVDVVFFERNGLRHGQFTLRAPGSQPDNLKDLTLEWNTDSTVLAVITRDRVQLWTTGNYHWYLKQEILCGPYQGRAPRLSWHAEKPLVFAVAIPNKVLCLEYAFAVSRGSTSPPHDHGAVAVIDGQTIKFTPFRTANAPPPMAMCEVEVELAAVDVAFSDDCSEMAVLHLGGVSLFALETKGPRLCPPKLVHTQKMGIAVGPANYEELLLQIAFAGPNVTQVLRCAGVSETFGTELVQHGQGAGAWQETDATLVGSVFASQAGDLTAGVISQDYSGKLSHYSAGGQSVLDVRFPSFMPWATLLVVEGQLVAFGLSRNGHLYANTRQLVKNCTSFLVTPSHLIFTTSNHLVKFVHLAASVDNLDVPQDDPENDERCRSIERGAKLVTAMPTRMSLVLQMPRGNLETIYPRAMVLAGIRELVEQKKYGEAFATCRTQRVDMNILYDHRPEQLLENISTFLDQVKDAANIDLFLSTLKNEDVTQTMYRDTKSQAVPAEPEASAVVPNKVNTVCDAFLEKLRTQKNANLQNIITANVCKSPPALDDGLTVVAELMEEDESLAERAVEHICFLVDVNRLYDHALGLYNLDLTLLVAQQSQRDPREYLPFIQELHKLPPLQRQFAIDDKLNRRDKALVHLKTLNDFSAVTSYVVKHNLYQQALTLYRNSKSHTRTLTDLYAAHLKSTSRFREAGLAYESLGSYPLAVDCYLKAGATSWRECLFAAQQQNDPPLSLTALRDIAATLADALREAKDHAAAATIQDQYLESVEAAVASLCKGYLFSDALLLVARRGRADLLEAAVDAGLVEAFSSSTEFLADCKAQLKAQVPRIAELRKKAREDPLAFYEGEVPHGMMDVPDDVSVAASSRVSTSASLFTRYTGKGGSVGTVGSNVSRATSKNRKREEKKRARGRKGTVYEEEYLVNSVRRLVERVEGGKGEVERLVFGLVRRDMAERARTIEELAAQVVEGCKVAVREVWGVSVVPEGEGVEGDGDGEGYRATGSEGVLQESLEAMRAKQVAPVVKELQRLELLGR